MKLVPHSEDWAGRFEQEKAKITECLRERLAGIEHVGSTAIPGLPAKPILDMVVGVDRIEDVEHCIEPLERIGYEYRGDRSDSGGHLFVKGPESHRTDYLHMVEINGPKWNDYILFRDYLRSDSRARAEYAELKRRLAEKYESDRETYTERKASFIQHILERARKAREARHKLRPMR